MRCDLFSIYFLSSAPPATSTRNKLRNAATNSSKVKEANRTLPSSGYYNSTYYRRQHRQNGTSRQLASRLGSFHGRNSVSKHLGVSHGVFPCPQHRPALSEVTVSPVVMRPSPIHGRGLFATKNQRRGDFVGEYDGDRLIRMRSPSYSQFTPSRDY